MNVGEIVTVITNSGEYVGKLAYQGDGLVKLDKPVMVMPHEGGLGFASSLAMTGEENPKEVTLYNVTLVVKTNDNVASGYKQHTGSLITPPSGLVI